MFRVPSRCGGGQETDPNDYAIDPSSGFEEYELICMECCTPLEKMGEELTTANSIPLYQCRRCKGDAYGIVRDPRYIGIVAGRVVNGQWYKQGPDGEMIPVDHPDDVWR